MKIGILQTGHAPDVIQNSNGDFDTLFHRLLRDQGFTFATYNVVDMQFPETVTACDGWLLTGSRHGAYEKLPFIPPLEVFIRDAYAADIPMVGICFGHQIIAQALGGVVEKFAGGWSVGRQNYTLNGQDLALNAWHQDQVVVPPKNAVVVGSNDFCANAALVYGAKAFTVQPHPEFDSDNIAGLIAERGKGVVPDPLLENATNQLEKPVANDWLAAQIGRFFKERTLA